MIVTCPTVEAPCQGIGSGTCHLRSIGVAAPYAAGDVTATNGSTSVTGSGTAWLTATRGPGDRITIDAVDYTIRQVTSQTALVMRCEGVSSSSLVADNRGEIGFVYEDGIYVPPAVGTPILNFSGSTSDATHTIRLTVADGNKHFGIPGSGVVLNNGANTVRAIYVQDDHVAIDWLEILGGFGSSAYGIDVNNIGPQNRLFIHNNIIHADGYGIRINDAETIVDIYNNFLYRNTREAIIVFGPLLAGSNIRILNNTIFDNNPATSNGADVRANLASTTNPYILLRNNIIVDDDDGPDFDMPWVNVGSSNNLSGDAPPPNAGHSPRGGGIYSVTEAGPNFVSTGVGTEDLHIQGGSVALDAAADLSGILGTDIDNGLRTAPWDVGADDLVATTAVALASFAATGYDGAVLLEWRTASELDNLGFHLYRSISEEGSYDRITDTMIPGLGSSPVGAKYSYRDAGLSNGVTYDYKLQDIETTGKTEFHGPVTATPEAGASSGSGDSGGRSSDDASSGSTLITYGDPSANSWRVLRQGRRQVVLELLTEGFYAELQEDGSVRITIPDFGNFAEAGSPSIPVKRTWVEALAGRQVDLVSVQARGFQAFTSLRPADADTPEIVATRDGAVRAARSRRSVTRSARAAFQGEGLYPSEAARVVSVGFQGEAKKALVELAPLRWDASRGQLLLARRLVVRLSFRAHDPAEHSTDGVRGRRYRKRRSHDKSTVAMRLVTTERGLHAIRYEEVLRSRHGVRARALRLSRQGESVSFHLEPSSRRFKPGSTLYFVSEGASANPYGSEAVYELAVGQAGESMPEISAAPSGEPTRFYWHREEWEENRYYQAALLKAPDRWLWDLLFAPAVKGYPFEVSALALSAPTEPSKLSVWLQGVSDFRANPDHHVRVVVNGTLVEELSWDGKQAQHLQVELAPGLLREGDNLLELENVGDTAAAYSMVMLDRYAVEYPRVALTGDGRLRGRWSESGAAELSGFAAGTHVLDVSEAEPRWLLDTELGPDGLLRFRAESGRSYLAVSPETVYHPAVTKPRASRLKNVRNRADYLVIGPEAFLQAAIPLLELRRSGGLKVKAVSIEEVYSEFGFGEPTPEAVKDFLSYAYHNWRQPSPRYVLLLGDATFDFKDHLQTSVMNQVPPRIVKTSYLWTASDPSYAAVNGDDLLPDLAIGRLPAATLAEAQAMVQKIVAYETGDAGLTRAPVVLVADNADRASNFEADADTLAASQLKSRTVRKIYLNELGVTATRASILQAFDDGASIVSYLGHGGIHLWASENVFNIRDAPSLSSQVQQPLLLTMNCLNGYFHFPYFNSLAEELVKAEGKGAIAAFSPSGLSLNGPAHRYHQALLHELFSGRHQRLGDAVLAAQESYAESGAFPELLSIYHLLGDPALTLR